MKKRGLFLAFVLVQSSSYQALGQQVEFSEQPEQRRRESVDYSRSAGERPIQTYDAQATRLGAWLLFPGLEIEQSYDSNIYATLNNEVDDFITILKPRARLDSDWSVHDVQLEIGGDFGFYSDITEEDFQDYYAVNGNRIEIVRNTDLITRLLYRHAHVPRSAPDSTNASAEPLVYDLLSGLLGFERDVAIFSLRVDGKVQDIKYEDSDRVGGGTIDNSDRDRTVIDGGFRLTYAPSAGNEAYFSTRLRDIKYDDSTRNGGPDRDNSGFDLTLGANKTVSDLWVVDVYLGYAPSYYADATLDDVTGGRAIVLGAELLWNPTALTSVIGNLDRRTYQTTELGASALVNTSLSLRVEHKLTRSLLLDGGIGYDYGDYVGSPREDNTYLAEVGAEYFFTRLISLRTGYAYRERTSTQRVSEYDKHRAFLQLRFNY